MKRKDKKILKQVTKRGKKPVFYEDLGFFKRKWDRKAQRRVKDNG